MNPKYLNGTIFGNGNSNPYLRIFRLKFLFRKFAGITDRCCLFNEFDWQKKTKQNKTKSKLNNKNVLINLTKRKYFDVKNVVVVFFPGILLWYFHDNNNNNNNNE